MAEYDPSNVLVDFDKTFANMRAILNKNESDAYVVKMVQTYCKKASKIETGMQLAAFCDLEQGRGRKIGKRSGKMIPVQPTAFPRRGSKSCSRKVMKSGRKIRGVSQSSKKLRNLAHNEKLNKLNAKSHGDGH
jgi:hypothetical protein